MDPRRPLPPADHPSPDRWQQIDRLFHSVVDRAPDERAAYLREACEGDEALRCEVESLVCAHEQTGSFLEAPPEPAGLEVGGTGSPERLGPYRVLRELGRGGMGRVYLAEQKGEDFRRLVAVKIVDPAGAGAEVERRFRDERRILAGLEHGGIARFYDAGRTPDGRWFLALEYVEGEDLRTFAERQQLGLRARVELFLQVLDAVDFAHRRLVVHRDLKPGNVLVDAQGHAKLLDFGISKILDPDSANPDVTRTQQRAFTPAYASPEQLRGERATIGTDIYSAGVVLYEILSGHRPFDLRGTTDAEPEPRPPSAVATQPACRHDLTGDLDAITLKALRPLPDDRYPSAAAFAADLRRWLAGDPVEAHRGGRRYRLEKFAARHRLGLAASAAVIAALAGGLSVALVQRSRALDAQARAEAETRKARAVREYLVSVFDVADPFAPPGQRGGDVTARALLDRGAARVDSVLAGQPEVQGELAGVLGGVYVNLGLYEKAGPLLRKSLDQRRASHGPRHAAVAEAMDQLGDLLTKQNQYAEAEPLLREALAQRRALLGDRDEATAESLNRLATHLQERNDYAAAEPLFREAVAVRRAIHGADDARLADSLNNLGLLLYLQGRIDPAEQLYREALGIYVRSLGEDHPYTAGALHNLAQVRELRGGFEEAESLYQRALAASRRALGDAHPDVTVNLNNLGSLLTRRGDPEKAEPLIREALALDRRIFGEHHDYTAESVRNLGEVLRAKGDFDEAERLFRHALEVNRSLFGAEHIRLLANLHALALTLQMKGDLARAVALLRETRARCIRLVGDGHRRSQAVSVSLARAVLEAGDAVEAEGLARAVGSAPTADGKPTPVALEGRIVLARALARQGRGVEALAAVEPVLPAIEEWFASGDWRIGEARLARGEGLAASGQPERAEPVVRQALAALRERRRAQPRVAREAETALAQIRRTLARGAKRG
ncbi:MAG: serine/threonine-protein kinase [Vicinamibacteria bacterium]